MRRKSFRLPIRPVRPTAPTYTAEPDWNGLAEMENEDALRAQTANSIREDYFRDRQGIKTETERINDADNVAQMQQIQAKAQFDAANFEKRYTAKQKAELARLSAMDGEIDSNPGFTAAEKAAAHKAVALKKLGIQPMDLPRLSPYPDGQGIGDRWYEDGIGFLSRKPDGSVGIIQGWDKSAQAQSAKDAHELEKNQMKIQYEREKEYNKRIMEEAFKPDAIQDGVDENGQPKYRARTLQEAKDFMREIGSISDPETDSEGRSRVAAMRKNAGLPSVEQSQAQSVPSTQESGQAQNDANAIIQEAIQNPEKMRDPTFAAKARAARKFLGK